MTRVAYDPEADNQRTGGGIMSISFSFNVNDTSSASQQLKTNVENVLADTENEIKADLNRLPDVSGESKKTSIPLYNNPSKQSELDAQHKAEMEYEEKSRLKAMTDKELENKIDAVNQKIDELGKNDFSAIQDKNGNVTSLAAAKARAEDEARSYGRTLSSGEIADIEDKYSKFELQNKQIEKANNDIEKYKNEQARRLAEEKASMDTSKQQLTTPSTTTQAINYGSDKRFIPDYNKMSLDEKKELQEKLTTQNTDYFTKTGTYNESVSSQLEKLNSAIEKEELKKYSINQPQLNPVIDKSGTENQLGDNITETEEVKLNTPTNWAKKYMDELERYQEKQKINQTEKVDMSVTNPTYVKDDFSIPAGENRQNTKNYEDMKSGAYVGQAVSKNTGVSEDTSSQEKLKSPETNPRYVNDDFSIRAGDNRQNTKNYEDMKSGAYVGQAVSKNTGVSEDTSSQEKLKSPETNPRYVNDDFSIRAGDNRQNTKNYEDMKSGAYVGQAVSKNTGVSEDTSSQEKLKSPETNPRYINDDFSIRAGDNRQNTKNYEDMKSGAYVGQAVSKNTGVSEDTSSQEKLKSPETNPRYVNDDFSIRAGDNRQNTKNYEDMKSGAYVGQAVSKNTGVSEDTSSQEKLQSPETNPRYINDDFSIRAGDNRQNTKNYEDMKSGAYVGQAVSKNTGVSEDTSSQEKLKSPETNPRYVNDDFSIRAGDNRQNTKNYEDMKSGAYVGQVVSKNTGVSEDDTSIGLGPKFGTDGWKAIHGATSVEEAQANVDKLLEEGANLYGTRTNELKAAMQELKVLSNKANITDLESKNNQPETNPTYVNDDFSIPAGDNRQNTKNYEDMKSGAYVGQAVSKNTGVSEDDTSIGLGPKFGTDGWKAIHGATSVEEAQANVDKLLEEGANLYGTRTNELKAAMQELKVLSNKVNITDLESKNNQPEQPETQNSENNNVLEESNGTQVQQESGSELSNPSQTISDDSILNDPETVEDTVSSETTQEKTGTQDGENDNVLEKSDETQVQQESGSESANPSPTISDDSTLKDTNTTEDVESSETTQNTNIGPVTHTGPNNDDSHTTVAHNPPNTKHLIFIYNENHIVHSESSYLLSQLLVELKTGINISDIVTVVSSNNSIVSITNQAGDYLINILSVSEFNEIITISSTSGKQYIINIIRI